MKAGRELDILIIEKMMGFKPCKCEVFTLTIPFTGWGIENIWYLNECCGGLKLGVHIPKFSKDISAAWALVEVLKEKYGHLTLGFYEKRWTVNSSYYNDMHCYDLAKSKTLPHAICLAALKASRATEKSDSED